MPSIKKPVPPLFGKALGSILFIFPFTSFNSLTVLFCPFSKFSTFLLNLSISGLVVLLKIDAKPIVSTDTIPAIPAAKLATRLYLFHTCTILAPPVKIGLLIKPSSIIFASTSCRVCLKLFCVPNFSTSATKKLCSTTN